MVHKYTSMFSFNISPALSRSLSMSSLFSYMSYAHIPELLMVNHIMLNLLEIKHE